MDESGTIVYDATDKVLGRLASVVAKQLLTARKAGNPIRIIVLNAEHAIVSGPRSRVFADYDFKYKVLIANEFRRMFKRLELHTL